MKAQNIFAICLIFSLGVNTYQYFYERQQVFNEKYFEARYQIIDQDVRTLVGVAAAHLSNLSLSDLTSHLENRGIKYRKNNYPKTPEFIYVLVGELTFRFTDQGVFVGVVQSKQ